MSLTGTFKPAASAPPVLKAPSKARNKRETPFSIRLTEAERARLASEAAGAPLGSYIKAKALGGPPLRSRRCRLTIQDRASLSQVLALLGRSHVASNLNQLARLAHIGALPLDSETVAGINEAILFVRELRGLLLTALGLKPDGQP